MLQFRLFNEDFRLMCSSWRTNWAIRKLIVKKISLLPVVKCVICIFVKHEKWTTFVKHTIMGANYSQYMDNFSNYISPLSLASLYLFFTISYICVSNITYALMIHSMHQYITTSSTIKYQFYVSSINMHSWI